MSTLFENTVCLAVTFHRPGDTRRFKPGEVEVRRADYADNGEKAAQSMVSASKRIFRNSHYLEAVRIDQKFDAFLIRRALNCPLKRGTYLVPVTLLDEVYEELDKAQAAYEAEATALAAEYDEAKEAARQRLRSLFNEKDYPAVDKLRRQFSVERRLFDFAPPGESKLSDAVYRQERERWADTFASAEEEVKQALRQAYRDLVAHLADRLAPTADGKKRRLHESAVKNLTEFLDLFDKRNVLNDSELQALVEQAKRILNGGGSANALRSNDSLREFVAEQLEEIKGSLDSLITEGPRRVVSFEEE